MYSFYRSLRGMFYPAMYLVFAVHAGSAMAADQWQSMSSSLISHGTASDARLATMLTPSTMMQLGRYLPRQFSTREDGNPAESLQFSLTGLNSLGSFHVSGTNAGREQHLRLGGGIGPVKLTHAEGSADGLFDYNNSFSGIRENLFHGNVRRTYHYQNDALQFNFTSDSHLTYGRSVIDARALRDRQGQYIGYGYRGLMATFMEYRQSSERSGQGFDIRYRQRRWQLGLQQLEDFSGASLYRLALQRINPSGSRWRLQLASARNSLYQDADDTRVLVSYQRSLGWRSRSAMHADTTASTDEEVMEENRNYGTAIAVGAGVAVAAVALSSGDDKEKTARFGTQHKAAIDVINDINPKSVKENREYGGIVYKNGDGTFSYTGPIAGTVASVNIGRPPPGKTGTASWHTHGGPDPRFINEEFSSTDIINDRILGWDGYLGTPAGFLKFHDVQSDTISVLGRIAN